MRVEVYGLNALVRQLLAAGADLDDLKTAFGSLATRGARLASSFAQVRSGRLAGSVRGNRAKNKAVITAGGARVPYAGPINYGWPSRRIAPSSFMQRADAALAPEAPDRVLEDIQNAIKSRGLD